MIDNHLYNKQLLRAYYAGLWELKDLDLLLIYQITLDKTLLIPGLIFIKAILY